MISIAAEAVNADIARRHAKIIQAFIAARASAAADPRVY